MKPEISIVMPVYNGEAYIEETIKSVQQQTFTDWEFIIINDASKDGTEKIIQEMAAKDERIIYVKNEKNSGVAFSLNRGLELAKGYYIARVDADDPIYRTRFEVQRQYMEEHPEIGVLGSAYMLVQGDVERPHIQRFLKKEELKASFLLGNDIPHSTVMIRKRVLDEHQLRYDVKYKLEDYELWSRVSQYTEVMNLRQILIKHRVHDASVCSLLGEHMYDDCLKVVEKYIRQTYEVDTEQFSKAHFYPCFIEMKNRVKESYVQYICDEFRLLSLIEQNNRKVNYVNPQVLSRILKIKWNFLINDLGLAQRSGMDALILKENAKGSFRFSIISGLVSLGLVDDEFISDDEISNRILAKLQSTEKKVIVYGVGLACYRYLDMERECLLVDGYDVVAFCDKDKAVIGNTFCNHKLIVPEEIQNETYDIIAVTSNKFFIEIKEQLETKYHIPTEKIINACELQ